MAGGPVNVILRVAGNGDMKEIDEAKLLQMARATRAAMVCAGDPPTVVPAWLWLTARPSKTWDRLARLFHVDPVSPERAVPT